VFGCDVRNGGGGGGGGMVELARFGVLLLRVMLLDAPAQAAAAARS